MHRWPVVLLTCLAAPLAAQQPDAPAARPDTTLLIATPPAATLTLGEALRQARMESPTFLQTLNDAVPARVGERSAYAAFLPTASVSGGLSYTGSGSQFFGGTFFRQPSSYGSSYSAGFQWQLSGRTFANLSAAKAGRRATTADIDGAGTTLTFDVTTQYLNALAAEAQVVVARQQLRRNLDFQQLAEARYRVGQATLLDVRQAEVQRGTAEVGVLRAVQAANEAKLELFRRIGITAPVSVAQVGLADTIALTPFALGNEDVRRMAEEQNPQLAALRAREAATRAQLRGARSEYLPSLFVQGGWAGFTQQFSNVDNQLQQALAGGIAGRQACLDNNVIRGNVGLSTTPDCNAANGLDASGTALLPAVSEGIRTRNNVFPFSFTGQPFQVSLSVSLPVFTGFQRSLRIAQAHAAQLDASEAVRGQALALRTQVDGRWLAVQTAWQAIGIQGRNREAAREQLKLAQDRYRIGNGTFLEVTDAQNNVQRAEGDYITAVYDYHRAVVALEAAVGRPLR